MDIAAIYTAIYDRLRADTGAGGLLASGAELVNGIFSIRATAGTAMPYLVVEVYQATDYSGFGIDRYEVRIRVHSYMAVSPTSGTGTQAAKLSALIVRIFTRLNRWQATLSGSWTITPLHNIGQYESHELPECYHTISEYRGWVQKAA